MVPSIAKDPDSDHLLALSICHYVLAGINTFVGCVPLIHVTMGILMMTGAFDRGPNRPPPQFGLILAITGGTISLIFWVQALANVLAGRCIGRRSYYRFCFAVAVLNCLNIPMGTLLAVFTFIVLGRPSVRAMFDGTAHRDPRMDALDAFERDEKPRTSPEPGTDGAIQVGEPQQ